MWIPLDPNDKKTFPSERDDILITVKRVVHLNYNAYFDETYNDGLFVVEGDSCGCGCGYDGTSTVYPKYVLAWMFAPHPMEPSK